MSLKAILSPVTIIAQLSCRLYTIYMLSELPPPFSGMYVGETRPDFSKVGNRVCTTIDIKYTNIYSTSMVQLCLCCQAFSGM